MRSLSRLVGASVVALSVTLSSFAFATDPSTAATAEHLFQQGLDAMKKNQFKEACDAFAGSNEADPSPGTQINLALCNEKQNKLASAWGWYRTAAGLAELRGQKERAELARSEATKLEPKLHKLVITVKAPAEGVTVTRNSVAVPSAAVGSEEPIDPGDYAIEVKAKGKKPWQKTIHIASGPGVDRVDVTAFEDAPPEPKAAGATPGSDYSPPAEGVRSGSTQRNVGFIVGGAGIVAGVVGIAMEFLALREDDKRKDAETSAADFTSKGDTKNATAQSDSAQSHKDAAKSNQLIAIVSGAGAVVLIGVGITLVLTAPSSTKAADLNKTRLFPLLGNGTGGLGLTGTF